MTDEISPENFPSRDFRPRIYGVGAWTNHVYFAYDLVAELRPRTLVELGVDRGESYFAFCQSALENTTSTRCFAVDTWKGDSHAGDYDETTFAQVAAHNLARYGDFSTLIRSTFDEAAPRFHDESIDILHLDGLHTEETARHDLESWLPKVRAGGILLLHDIGVRTRDFGVWKVWEELRQRGRSFAFDDGPGLGVWEKPGAKEQPKFLEDFFAKASVAPSRFDYYSRRARGLQETISAQWRDGTIRTSPAGTQTVIQIFYTSDGVHSEANSVNGRVGHGEWKEVSIALPPGAGAAPLRIDFVSPFTEIDLASIRVREGAALLFEAKDEQEFAAIHPGGDLELMTRAPHLRVRVTGIDPQLYLPALETNPNAPLTVELRLCVHAA